VFDRLLLLVVVLVVVPVVVPVDVVFAVVPHDIIHSNLNCIHLLFFFFYPNLL
jgi:hypothetical protein